MRLFIAVAEELHFGRAARRLNMSQPPLSQSIKRLELDLGVQLFNRSRRSTELTSAGRVFLDHARRTLLQVNLAREATQREALKIPEVRLSFVGPALYRVLPKAIVRYRSLAPDIQIRLFERASPDQITGIQGGEFDVGFVLASPSLPSDFETLLVERTVQIAAVPMDCPLVQKDRISLTELAEQPFILPPERNAEKILSIFRSVGLVPMVAQEASQINTAISLVSAGLGCTMVPATAKLKPAPNVRYLPISDTIRPVLTELLMVWLPDDIGKWGDAFVDFMQDFVRDNEEVLDPNSALR